MFTLPPLIFIAPEPLRSTPLPFTLTLALDLTSTLLPSMETPLPDLPLMVTPFEPVI